jgi:hypothetical protein
MAAMASALFRALQFGALCGLALHAAAADAARIRFPSLGGTPKISGTPPANVIAGSPYDFRPTASDPNGDTLVFRINKLPRWARFDPATGRLWGTPTLVDIGRIKDIRISVTDGVYVASLPSFTLRVSAGGSPTISGTPETSTVENQYYAFQPTAADPDGQALTFAVMNKPSWASFDAATGRLSGTPPAGSAGSYASIGISVTDGARTASLAPFAVTVAAASIVNRAPQISGTPPTSVLVGEVYAFTPTTTDPDRDLLRFWVLNAPSWLMLDAQTGQLRGVAPAGSVGTYRDIVMSVTDGTEITFLAPFSITVSEPPASAPPANSAPTISGAPPTSVTAGQAYSFTPTASDPDSGQTLRFGIANPPSWANFDTVTGRLSGTPTSAQVGTYSNIVISVSDGALSATLPAFSITVADVQTGSATLRWTPPTLNEDGSTITNLRGFRIYYGTSSTNLSRMVELPNPGLTSAVVENLSPATWYFAVKAYNTLNVESALSNIASKTIR